MDQEYETMELLRTDLINYWKKYNVILTTRRSDKHKLQLDCIHADKAVRRNNMSGLVKNRFTGTIKNQCPFTIKCTKVNGIWSVKSIKNEHNHEIPEDINGYARSKRLSEKETSLVSSLFDAGVQPRKIRSVLLQEGNSNTTMSVIYNEKNKHKKILLNGQTSLNALVRTLQAEPYFYSVKHDVNDSLTALFFMHTKSILLSKQFHLVFLMDSTYKANKWKMPLFNIVGVAATGKTFNAGISF